MYICVYVYIYVGKMHVCARVWACRGSAQDPPLKHRQCAKSRGPIGMSRETTYTYIQLWQSGLCTLPRIVTSGGRAHSANRACANVRTRVSVPRERAESGTMTLISSMCEVSWADRHVTRSSIYTHSIVAVGSVHFATCSGRSACHDKQERHILNSGSRVFALRHV